MGRPQDNRLQRSGNTPLDPDHIETEVQTQPHAPRDEPGGGPIPRDQQPGHHPPTEQDKPDLDAFAERLGVPPEAEAGDEDGGSADTGTTGEGHGPLDTVRAVAATAVGLAEPVAHLVKDNVSRAARLIDERRGLTGRVERLEQQVAELTDQLAEQRRAG
jgi:hypothetical protein